MKIHLLNCSINSLVVAVIPTVNPNSPKIKGLIKDLHSNEVDCIVVEESVENFSLSKCMNVGINHAIDLGIYKIVILSDDTIKNINGLKEMILYVWSNRDTYSTPFINGISMKITIISSPFQYTMHQSVQNKAPFFARKVVKTFNWKNRNIAIGCPTLFSNGMLSVLPFSVFDIDILRTFLFDEKIVNGFEDDEFTFRLNKSGIYGMTNKRWNVNTDALNNEENLNHKYVTLLKTHKIEQLIKNGEYFYRKYFKQKVI